MYYREQHDNEDGYNADIRAKVEMSDTKQHFVMPPLNIPPKAFVAKHFGPGSNLPADCHFKKGTTTLAFMYKPKTAADKGGIVVAVDSRATGGSFISTKDILKILPINKHMVATMAGGAADCQFWTAQVSKYCNLFELREGREITVSAASKYFSNVMYSYRNHGLSLGSLLAGYDTTGPSIYMVDDKGMRIKADKYVSVGSGSLGAYGVLDTHYKEAMTDQEALTLGRRAIMHATYRDGASGGQCNVRHITKDGVEVFPPLDVSELFYEFAEEKNLDLYPTF